MKKLLKIIICMNAFFTLPNTTLAAVTSTITEEIIPNVRIAINKNNNPVIYNVSKITANRTEELIYSPDPSQSVSSGTYNEAQLFSEINKDLSITEEEWKKVQCFTYFGYNYNNRTSIDWYIATQYLIWDYLLEDEIYFVDEYNQKINLYEKEINTIKKDYDEMYIYPSFATTSFNGELKHYKINDKITLTDTFNILHKFNVEAHNGVLYEVDGNTLTLTFKKPGTTTVYFPSIGVSKTIPRIYFHNDNTFYISKGHIPVGVTNVSYMVDYPTVTITSNIEDDVPLTNASYGVYMTDGTLFEILTANELSTYPKRQLLQGEYYIEQINPATGYEPNPSKIYFTIDEDDIVINIKETPLKKELTLKNFIVLNNEEKISPNTTFELYKGKKLINTIKTDSKGLIKLSLTYGTYSLKEIDMNPTYTYLEPLNFTIDDVFNNNELIIKKYEILGSIILTQIDNLTGNLIKDNISYKFLNKETNKYLDIDGINTFESENGTLSLTNIPYGVYIIEQTLPLKNYLTLKPLTIDIDTNNKVSIKLKLDPIEEKKTSSNIIESSHTILNKPTKHFLNNLEEEHSDKEFNIDVPKTGTNEFLISLLISVIILLVGVRLCNYGKKN